MLIWLGMTARSRKQHEMTVRVIHTFWKSNQSCALMNTLCFYVLSIFGWEYSIGMGLKLSKGCICKEEDWSEELIQLIFSV